ncbi:MAG: flagellar hook-associated protein FlgL [Gemmatimonadales bacterium]
MRITNALQRDESLRQIQSNLERLAEFQQQVATGKRFTRVEQDPLAATQVLRVERGIRAIDQYAKNGTAAQVRLGAEEAVVNQLDDLLRQGRDFALSFAKGDPPYTASQATQRQIAADQLTGLLDQAISMANTRIGNEYILAGDRSTTPPFDPTAGPTLGTYQGGTQERRTETADGVFIAVNHTGDQYVGPAIAALKALRDAVDPANNQTEAQVQTEVTAVFAAGENLLVSLAQTGVAGAQLAATLRNNTSYKNDLESVRNRVQGVPLEEAIAKLLSLQTTIEASYTATSRLLSLTLTDYLR